MTESHERITELKRLETAGDLDACEEEWTEGLEKESGQEMLVEYNRFRLRNLPKLEKKRPAVLVGAINNYSFPNFHTLDLLKVADVVSLTARLMAIKHPDRLSYEWEVDRFPTICSRLPNGFQPDLFWDAQAAHSHIHPQGLEEAPFPTVAGLCHVQQAQVCRSFAMLFDFVAPVGRSFDPFFLKNGRAQVLKLPFGLNWASFHDIFSAKPNIEADIDLSLTFAPSDDPVYGGLRGKVVKIVERFRQKWGEQYHIEIVSGLQKDEYEEILGRSRISVNVVGLNGPYNYRTCEIMNAGALLLQLDTTLNPSPSDDEELFVEGEHFVRFQLDNFEEIALDLLRNPNRVDAISAAGAKHLLEEYSYERIYENLIREVTAQWQGPEREIPPEAGDFLLGSAMCFQASTTDFPTLGTSLLLPFLSYQEKVMLYANVLAFLPEMLEVFDRLSLAMLMRESDPVKTELLQSGEISEFADYLLKKDESHPALLWNFLALAAENGWLPRHELIEVSKTHLKNMEWPAFDGCFWLLRHQARPNWVSPNTFSQILTRRLVVAIFENEDGDEGEWRIYRDYLVEILSLREDT